MSDNIKVVVKVRPLISRELEDKLHHQWRVNNNTLFQLDCNGRDVGPAFTFDKVYSENTKTSDVYNDVAKPIVEAAVAGFNGTIFAYGQTSSGKTYTMTGTEEAPGIIPLAVLNLFETIKNVPGRDFVVSVSYIEIYNETLKDLLDLKKTVKIRETYNNSIKVDASEKVTASPEEVLEAMKEGNANRHTGSTNMNESSSRSHSIFQINIESREHIEGEEQAGCVNVSQLNLVDLAGSERAGQTGATGIRFKEGTLINKSLTSLAHVIKQLSEEPNKYINYRDSNLTRILQNSLGGNAKTCIICAITPAALEETNSTLQFATRAKAIKNKPEVNAVATDATMIQKLTKQLSKLQSQLEQKKNLEDMLETKKNREQTLQIKIANLQRFILNGFGQRPNVELVGGARRKLNPQRRVTISTLHSIEDDCPKVPRFCTPALKYNPSHVQNLSDFLPLNNPNKLPSLPEEPPRLITPPLNERKINISDEIIELDSDDDESSSVQLCSPYHDCFGATKTPPCVLRKNAKQAEKNLRDLVELTDREKIYTPSVVELIEKLENSTSITVKLQDEIEVLKTISKEKDLEIETLRSRINTNEQEITSYISVASELQSQHKKFSTKLTEWEVSYEKLKNKAKLREQELLFLLEEQTVKKAEDIGKMLSKPKDKEIIHFMDMSKDISLVNSDNDSSLIQPDEVEHSERTNILLIDMQAQLAAKNQIILDLESDINSQKIQIERLEKSSHDLLGQVNSFKEKLSYLENENVLLQSTVDELNSTIKCQTENLKLFQNDTNSYISVIQELQIKLTKKENLLSLHISDTLLESMLVNEDKTIANNENLRNLIHAFKLALENSRKEIDSLNSRIQNNIESGDEKSIDNLRMKEVEVLNDEISKLTKLANENMVTINTLLREKKALELIEQELIKKLTEVEQRNSEHDILSKEQATQIENLKKDIEKLELSLAEKYYSNGIETLLKPIHEATSKIKILEEDIQLKDTLIANLNTRINEYQDCLDNAKLAINKLQDIFLVLTGEVREIPDILDSFVIIYNTLNNNLNILENIAVETVFQKDLAQKNTIELKKELSEMMLQHKLQIQDVTKTNENLSEIVQKLTDEIKLLNDKKREQSKEIDKIKLELDNKHIDLSNLEMQLNAVICEKDLSISSLKENEIVLLEKIEELKIEANSILKSKEDMHLNLSNKKKQYKHRLNELEDELQQKCLELTRTNQKIQDTENENDLLVKNIIIKLSIITDNIKQNYSSVTNRLMNHDYSDKRDHILPILDVVVDHIVMQSPIEVENKELKSELEIISDYNKSLKCDLKRSSDLLQNLQEELKIKVFEMNTIEHKAQEYKKQFSDFDVLMKKQMLFLQSENEKLRTRHIELNKETMQFDLLAAEKNVSISEYEAFLKSGAESKNNGENLSPPSLLTICVNTIIEAINPKQNGNISETTSSLCVENIIQRSSANTCPECNQLDLELRAAQQENFRLLDILEQLELANKELLNEQNEIRDEVRLLPELTQELQKKIVNHRVNLSISTATTYAENKSLKSQVKGLQHHHSRFHNVCQRDLPEFKKQLNELMDILRDDSSFCDGLNFSYRRYCLPNSQENNSSICQNKNESTFDNDLLMLDTNVTLTTADNTLVGFNQTCLDLTPTVFNETGCQTIDYYLTEPNIMLSNQIDVLKNENKKIYLMCNELKVENAKLKEQFTKSLVKKSKQDAHSNPIKISSLIDDVKETKSQNNRIECELLTEKLIVVTKQKEDIEKKYSDLALEMSSNDALIHKIKSVEEDLKKKIKELSYVTDTLNAKTKELNDLQKENDSLSTQVFETISDVDDLNKQLEKLKQQNQKLLDQLQELELVNKSKVWDRPQLDASKKKNCEKNGSKLSRSLSDSDSTSSLNKISTLRSEINAGLEDCKVFTEDIATIKHIDPNNMSMDLDESMNFELANESLTGSPQSKKINMPYIQEQQLDLYTVEKNDCLNYYSEKTGIVQANFASNIKIIEIMQRLYNALVTRHGNEVENLVNKLNDYQETQDKLLTQISAINTDYSKSKKDLEEKEKSLTYIANVVTQLRDNLSHTKPGNSEPLDLEGHGYYLGVLKDKFLSILDKNFNLSSVNVFEQITDGTNKLIEDYNSVNEVLTQTKCHLSEREKECNLLKNENERIREINNAVTLDIVSKEQESNNIIKKTYHKLVELDMIRPDKVPLTEPVNMHVLIRLLEHFISKYQKEKAKVGHEMNDAKAALAEKEIQIKELLSNIDVLNDVNNKNTRELTEKYDKIKELEMSQDELNKAFNIKVEENNRNLKLIENLIEETDKLKAIIHNNDQVIISLSDKQAEAKQLLNTVSSLQEDNEKFKAINEMISKEAKSYASELEKSCATIKQNNIDIDKMTSDILSLRESMKETTAHVDKLKQEVQTLARENIEIKKELEIKNHDCSRLEINIKTHEKTAEIQNRMIMRLQKLKEDDDKVNSEKQTMLSDLTEKYATLQTECEALKNTLKILNVEIENLRTAKESLENRLAESEESGRRSRTSIDAIAESSKRRRQSLHDSKRLFDKLEGGRCDRLYLTHSLGHTQNCEKNGSKLSRSLSDSDSTSSLNKISTLRSEINAGLEDCKVFTEDIATIKHIDPNNMSMDLDESMNFELANESLTGSPQSKKINMPYIQEQQLDLYTVEKNDCLNYYSEKTGIVQANFASNIKIIEIMQRLYNALVTRHGNEVENLVNKLNDYQETQDKLLTQISAINTDYSKSKKDLEEKEKSLTYIANVVTQLRDNLSHTKPGNSEPLDLEGHGYYLGVLKDKFLSILDKNFNLSSVNVFEQITDGTNKLIEDYNSVNEVLTQTKCHLSEREKECNLLKNENERIREINNAVTLDIVSKEQESNNIIKKTYHKLVELDMIRPDKVPLTEPVNMHVLIRLLEHFISKYQKEKAKVGHEMNDAKAALAEKEIQIKELLSNIDVLNDVNNKNTRELTEKYDKIKELEMSQDELNKAFNIKVEENNRNLKLIENLIEETDKLKAIIHNNDQVIISLSDKQAEAKQLLNTVSSLQEDNEKFKAINEMISKEAKSYASELEKSCATIKQNNIDIDKMTSDILSLRESMKETTAHVDKLKQEVQTLARENIEIKKELEIKNHDCSRLEINIKTHEKTAEIQNRMIMRLQKLKEDDDKVNSEKQTMLSDLTEKYATLQTECEALKNTLKILNVEIENLRTAKESLENRLAESEESGRRSRTSIDAIAESSKRRRQSLHDSKRLFDKLEEHKNLDALFKSRQNPEDLFMDVDDDNSGRSTPFGLGKGRDSLLTRTDNSDKDEEHLSRPSSSLAQATRRRRQSSHDLHRSVTPHALSPTDLSSCVIDELQQLKEDTSRNRLLSDNEITQLRTQLASCEKELEDLKERYRELDEECETCSEYLRERDEQCSRLKKEKAALLNQVTELKTKADDVRNSFSFKLKPRVAHVSVNTDEDWTNLHAVVVDRMSYDAEVEKNKKLTKTNEELRFTKLELKNTLAKMQKALEKNATKDYSRELEETKQALKLCKDELKDLRMKYKELDEECETCSNYLKEREEQCRQLKVAKTTLEARLKSTEAKLDEQEKSPALEHTKSVRKKRQTIHDMNRPETSTVEQMDAFTETTKDLSPDLTRDHRQEAGDNSSRDAQYLMKMVEQLTRQKEHLEHQLRILQVAQPMFVATGSAIVQNQQITDVMKENQKLKKINAKLVTICKKRGKSANRENEDPCEQGCK